MLQHPLLQGSPNVSYKPMWPIGERSSQIKCLRCSWWSKYTLLAIAQRLVFVENSSIHQTTAVDGFGYNANSTLISVILRRTVHHVYPGFLIQGFLRNLLLCNKDSKPIGGKAASLQGLGSWIYKILVQRKCASYFDVILTLPTDKIDKQ